MRSKDSKSTEKWNIQGVSDELLKKVKEKDRKKFMSLMGRLYLRSSEEVLIEEIFNKTFRIFIREQLFNDGVLEIIVEYAYNNNLTPFNKDGTINSIFINHIFKNTDNKNILHDYFLTKKFY